MLWIMGIVAAIPPLAWIPRHTDLLSTPALGARATSHGSFRSDLRRGGRAGVCLALGPRLWPGHRRPCPGAANAFPCLCRGADHRHHGVDLVTLDRGYHGSIPLAEANPPVPATIRFLQAHQGDARVTVSGPVLEAKHPERYGLRDPRVGDQALRPSRYTRLWTALGAAAAVCRRAIPNSLPLGTTPTVSPTSSRHATSSLDPESRHRPGSRLCFTCGWDGRD